MEQKQDNSRSVAYQIGKTMYEVRPVFQQGPDAEQIAEKVQRLILNDSETKSL